MKRIAGFVVIIFILWTLLPFAYADDKEVYKEGIKYLEAENNDLAFLKFNHIVEIYINSKYRDEALFRVGEYYFNSKNFIQAKRRLKEHKGSYAESIYKDKVEVLLKEIELFELKREADKFYDKRAWEAALSLYEKVLSLDKDNSAVQKKINTCKKSRAYETSKLLVQKGDALLQEKQFEKASKLYSQALKADSSNNSAKEKLSECEERISLQKEQEEQTRAFILEQKEKGLVEYNGKWVTLEEYMEEKEATEKAKEKQLEEYKKRRYSDSTNYEEICLYAKAAVLSNLKSPSKANFSVCDKNTVSQKTIGEYEVFGYVDANNPMGGQMRSDWYVVLKVDLLNKYVLKDIDINTYE